MNNSKPKKDIFYFYKITNNINGKFYFGVHATSSKFVDRYMGSGKYLQKAQKKYGLKHFSKEILKYFSSSKEMYEYEASFVNQEFLIKNHSMCYNLICGGKGGASGTIYIEKDGVFMRILPEFLEEFILAGWQCRGTSKGRVCVKKDSKVLYVEKKDLQQYLESGWKQEGNSRGLIRIEKGTDQKFVLKSELEYYISEGWKPGVSNARKAQQSQAIRGRVHINDGTVSKMVSPDKLLEYLDKGWKRGRLLDEHIYADKISKALKGIKRTEEAKERYRQSKLGCRYINNGTENKMIKSNKLDLYLNSGWTLGMIKNNLK